MSDDPGPKAIPAGPPWSLDDLADLHAGVYPAEISAALRVRMMHDPAASAILSALDSTVGELSLLPTPRMPERFALRLDATIAAQRSSHGGQPQSRTPPQPRRASQPGRQPGRPEFEPGRGQTIVHHGPLPPGQVPPGSAPPGSVPPVPTFRGLTVVPQPRSGQDQLYRPPPTQGPAQGDVVALDAGRSRRRRWIGGVAAAAAVVIGTITVTALNTTAPTGSAAGPASSTSALQAPAPANPVELQPGRFQDAYAKLDGADTGPLIDTTKAAACYRANNIVGKVLGVSQVIYQGRQASAVAVAVDSTHARIVVVGLQCGVDGGAAYLASETVAR